MAFTFIANVPKSKDHYVAEIAKASAVVMMRSSCYSEVTSAQTTSEYEVHRTGECRGTDR